MVSTFLWGMLSGSILTAFLGAAWFAWLLWTESGLSNLGTDAYNGDLEPGILPKPPASSFGIPAEKFGGGKGI